MANGSQPINAETVTHTVELPTALNQKALQFAERQRVSFNDVVSAALYAYFNQEPEPRRERSSLLVSF